MLHVSLKLKEDTSREIEQNRYQVLLHPWVLKIQADRYEQIFSDSFIDLLTKKTLSSLTFEKLVHESGIQKLYKLNNSIRVHFYEEVSYMDFN